MRTRFQALASPAALLMLADGDSRLAPEPETGLNRYGCSPWPRPGAIEFSSCTASTISPRGLNAAEALHGELALAETGNRLEEAIGDAARAIRREISALIPSSTPCRTILTASGTTATLIATWLALGDSRSPADILVPGLEESGRGVPMAAAGRHPDSRTPTGAAVQAGAVVEGFPTHLAVQAFAVRAEDGAPLAEDEIAGRIEAAIASAHAAGRGIVLHAMEGSKTGLVVPGLARVRELTRRWPDLRVIVDACQWRCDPEILAGYIDAGCLVVVTGSKFFCGPALIGAVLVPEAMSGRPGSPARGLADYSWRTDWPQGWRHLADSCCPRPNPGLLLRWRAALAEIAAYRATPPDATKRRRSAFAAAVRDRFTGGDFVLLPGPESIASFAVTGRDGRFLDEAALRRVYHLLNQDVSALLPATAPAAERLLAARLVHIGQPVAITGMKFPALLRLAIGARQLCADEPLAPLLDLAVAKLRLVRDYLV